MAGAGVRQTPLPQAVRRLTDLFDLDDTPIDHQAAFHAWAEEFAGLAEPVGLLWSQYRRRIPELATCRPEGLDALEQLRGGGWRIGIVTNGMAGGLAAGLRTVWINPSQRAVPPDHCGPELTVAAVAEAVQHLLSAD